MVPSGSAVRWQLPTDIRSASAALGKYLQFIASPRHQLLSIPFQLPFDLGQWSPVAWNFLPMNQPDERGPVGETPKPKPSRLEGGPASYRGIRERSTGDHQETPYAAPLSRWRRVSQPRCHGLNWMVRECIKRSILLTSRARRRLRD
jgi:hypothetical protein